ncbi:MAG: roadblock/LC7 domain-containing protein [bacterium]
MSKKMATIKEILGELLKIDGVRAAIVVGRDGFTIESVTVAGMDIDAVGAVLSSNMGPAEVMGNNLQLGELTQNMVEYKSGNIVLSILGTDAILGVVADTRANLGVLRYTIKKISKELEQTI